MPKVTLKNDCAWYEHTYRRGETVVVPYEAYTDLAAAGMLSRAVFGPHELKPERHSPFDGKIEGRHEGKRIFILGCGPSIASSDLAALHGEITIGVNRIIYAFQPDYIVWLDQKFTDGCGPMLEQSPAAKFCAARVRTVLPVVRFQRYTPRGDMPFLSPEFGQGLYWSRTSIFPAINLAVIFGAREIVLLGVEMDDASHFYDRRNAGEPFPNRNRIIEDFRKLLQFTRERGIGIYNASPGASLAFLPRR